MTTGHYLRNVYFQYCNLITVIEAFEVVPLFEILRDVRLSFMLIQHAGKLI